MVQVGPGQKVHTDHFQTIVSRSVASKYQSCGLDRPLNDGNLEDSDFLCLSGRRGSEPWLGDVPDPQEKGPLFATFPQPCILTGGDNGIELAH